MASELIKHISDASFEADVLQPGTTVLVDYWAEWCGPCKMIAPILDEVADSYQGKLTVAKMNVDENREVPAKFGIRGIPTLMLFKDGQARRHEGRRDEQGATHVLHRPAGSPEPLSAPGAPGLHAACAPALPFRQALASTHAETLMSGRLFLS